MEAEPNRRWSANVVRGGVGGIFLWVCWLVLSVSAYAATYGDGPYGGGEYDVGEATTTTTLISSVNPSTYGSGVTLTATVTGSSPTGTVTFKDGSTTIGTASLGNGSGRLLIATLVAGSHSLMAVYGGDGGNLTSTSNSVTQTVNQGSTSTTLTSSTNPSLFGSSITLTASVTPSDATGSVTFKDGSTTLGTATVRHGSGSLTTSSLAVGSHVLTATYSGDGNDESGNSLPLTQAVNAASTGPSASASASGGSGGHRGSTSIPVAPAQTTAPAANDSAAAALPQENGHIVVNIGERPVVFYDTPVTAWYAPYVAKLLEKGVASGYQDAQGNSLGLFGSGNPITYAELAKMALKAAGKDGTAAMVPRNASARGTWAAPYVAAAEQMHLSVYTALLPISEAASRGAVIETLLEAFDIPIEPAASSPYSDLRPSDRYAAAILTATKLGIISGDTNPDGSPRNTVRPNDPINRAEVAKILSAMF